VIEEANKRSLMHPSRRRYADGQSAMLRYPYVPGKLYVIHSAPQHPTTILLPPGDRLAAPPTLNPEQWVVAVAELADGGQRTEAVIVRPVQAGLTATTPLLTQSGRVFFCRVQSFETTSMVAVTWNVPQLRMPPAPRVPLASPTPAPRRPDPQVDHTPLFNGYRVEPQGTIPPWLPTQVYDDGSKTIIRFKHPLTYTVAPAVFVRHADGKAGVADFTPGEGYYIVQGLWPQLLLKGTDDLAVRITRLAVGNPGAEHGLRGP
jgi:type IV secretion system protein VirB9